MNITSLSRIDLLNRYVQKWLEMPRMTRAKLADQVVDAYFTLGFDEHLQHTGIKWCLGGDDFEKDMRHNQQKLFRWLGLYEECKSSPANLFYVEQVIVAAMPAELKTGYLNEVYMCSGVAVARKAPAKRETLDVTELAMKLIKESGEAQMAALNLGVNPTKESLITALREISESEAACAEARRAITEHYQVPEMKNHRRSFGEQSAVVSTNEHMNEQRSFKL
ncbi:hypothetical protein NFHSH190041_20210 [Shewanella sp. NFH-SH190041]|uniref:hypothetical protein n=1 Tax=Shewanella sp. NFH-SH190041 TaxID=2950245 RepID=UPI0021C47D19|nr:hypothetical protein [Shewanella sp. NFH-SH190041]BDM64569.1 hypothetical protein NFHSH190041_20210 [Shewanella sp. NFH-SH190041]